jgi:hypothetical protein
MVLEPRTYKEKRNFIRMRIDTPVEVTCGSEQFTARCRDLSGSGMLLASDRRLPLDAEVSVVIAQEGENRSPFHATGNVVRADPAEEGGYTVGLALTAIHD